MDFRTILSTPPFAAAFSALTALQVPFEAQEEPAPWEAPAQRVRAQLVLDRDSLAPGEACWGLLELQPETDWHLYWEQPGDAGEPPRISWDLPEGLEAGPLLFPAPTLLREDIVVEQVHHGRLALPFLVRVAPDAQPPVEGNWKLAADATWLVCREACEFELQSFELQLRATPPQPAEEPSEDLEKAPLAPANASIAAAVAKLPVKLDGEALGWSRQPATASAGPSFAYTLADLPQKRTPDSPALAWKTVSRLEFFPREPRQVAFGTPAKLQHTAGKSLTFGVEHLPSATAPPSGVLVAHWLDGSSVALDLPAPTQRAAQEHSSDQR